MLNYSYLIISVFIVLNNNLLYYLLNSHLIINVETICHVLRIICGFSSRIAGNNG